MKYIINILLISILLPFNYSEDISPIIYDNCTSCHREGQIASFLPLTNYYEVFDNRYWILYAISGDNSLINRHGNPIMPPWPPDPIYSNLLDPMILTEDQIHTLITWVEEGAMQGDPDNEYPMPSFTANSLLGEPDIVISMNEPYLISGDYEDDYRCFILDTPFSESINLAALEFVPGNMEVVHHAIIVAVPEGSVDYLDVGDSEYGYECFGDFGTTNISDFLGGYAPGTIIREWPNALAQKIPANSDLIMQIHYAPIDIDQIDQSSINIFVKDGTIDRYVNEYLMVNSQFALPPNEITSVTTRWEILNHDISLLQFMPHAHLLGKSWEIYAIRPLQLDTIPIIKINNWDFDWQFFYSPKYMIHLPQGSVVEATCMYDNTINNPDNPNDPPQWTFWGDDTNDEMFFIPFRYVVYEEGDENIFLGDYLLGDINEDGNLDIMDVVSIINIILSENCPINTDVNSDNYCNVLDVVQLIEIILNL